MFYLIEMSKRRHIIFQGSGRDKQFTLNSVLTLL